MKGVIYARYSSDNQREESIEGQLRECKAFAEKNDITIFSTYIDRALSARTDNRPDFQRMIKDSEKGLFDVIIVWKLDRFARDRYDSAKYKRILKKNGVRVISATEQIAEDSTGILIESILEGYAEYYSAELSEKVTRGHKENAYKCKFNGGNIPLGYAIDKDQHYQIDKVKSSIVRSAFQRYADGATLKGLVDWFENQGVLNRWNKPLKIDTVKRLLKNRRYIGEYRYRDIVIEGGIPAIIDQELFDKVQDRLEKNYKAPARFKAVEEQYLLTSKLFCGICGKFMVGESGTSHTRKFYQYYKCVGAKTHKICKKKAVRKKWIEDIVVSETMEMLRNDEVFNCIIDIVMEEQGKENVLLPVLRQQLTEIEKGIDNLVNAIQQGIISTSTKKRLDELESKKTDLEIAILREEQEKPILTREQITFFLDKYRQMDVTRQEERQRLVDTFINAVYMYDDKIVLTFNYKEGAKTIMLKDIKEGFDSDLEADGVPQSV